MKTARPFIAMPADVRAARGKRTQDQAARVLQVTARQYRKYEKGVVAISRAQFMQLCGDPEVKKRPPAFDRRRVERRGTSNTTTTSRESR